MFRWRWLTGRVVDSQPQQAPVVQARPAQWAGPVPVVSSYFSSNIVNYVSTHELFQSRLINCVALTEMYCSRFFRIKTGIEEFLRIFQQSALKKINFYCLLESANSTNQPPVRPYRRVPFPFLSNVRVGLADKFAQAGDHLAAPVGKFCDLCVDTFRWVHPFLLPYHSTNAGINAPDLMAVLCQVEGMLARATPYIQH